MYTCGDMKESSNGGDVKELRDIYIRRLIYTDVEVTEKNGKNQKTREKQGRRTRSVDDNNDGPV